MLQYKTISDSDLMSPPPPPDTDKVYFYGYILGASCNEDSDADLAALEPVLLASDPLNPHAHIITSPTAYLVFFALFDPVVQIVTPRPGCRMIPCDRLLRKFEREAGITSAPQWHEERGLIFPPGLPYDCYTYKRSLEPLKGLLPEYEYVPADS